MWRLAAATLGICVIASHAHAATCSATTSGVTFPLYTPNQALPADSSGTVTINCSKGALDILPLTVHYTVDLSRGGSSGFSPRAMKSGSNSLNYNLYTDVLHTTLWGDTTGGTSHADATLILPLILGSANGIHTVYGRIFASQNVVPGSYSDTVVVTISY